VDDTLLDHEGFPEGAGGIGGEIQGSSIQFQVKRKRRRTSNIEHPTLKIEVEEEEDRGQRTEDRGQRSEGRGQRAEGRGRNAAGALATSNNGEAKLAWPERSEGKSEEEEEEEEEGNFKFWILNFELGRG
jgi:hypothetical protein